MVGKWIITDWNKPPLSSVVLLVWAIIKFPTTQGFDALFTVNLEAGDHISLTLGIRFT